MADEEYYRNLSDAKLESLTKRYVAETPGHDAALKKIYRRKEIKETKDKKYQKQSKSL